MTRANDLILYDRGYPAFWLFAVHHQEVTSVPCCWNREVVLFTPGSHARQHCQTYGLATDPIPLRLIRVKLKNGEIEVLATSLLDEQTYCAGAWK